MRETDSCHNFIAEPIRGAAICVPMFWGGHARAAKNAQHHAAVREGAGRVFSPEAESGYAE